MAVFNGFPATYQPIYQPYAQPVQKEQNPIIWVQGEAGAKSYLVAPNNTVQLWDSEAQTIYLKSADASGMPSMKIIDYTIRESNKNTPISPSVASNDNSITYATKDEIKAVTEQITALRDRVDNLTRKKSREVTDDE